MNLVEWEAHLNQLAPPTDIRLGLDRVRAVWQRLDRRTPRTVITVAGTNGKGSTVEALGFLLRAAGWREGQYTSPHLHHVTERIRVAGTSVSDHQLARALDAVETARGEEFLTYFEYLTLASFWLLQAHEVDYWVCEIGLGGRLDAVNILDPDVSIITSIGLDHQDFLGDTLEAIAREKAGVMRSGRVTWSAAENVREVLTAEAARRGADLRWLSDCLTETGLQVGNESVALDAAQLPLSSLSLSLKALESMNVLPEPLPVQQLCQLEMPGRMSQRSVSGIQWIFDVGHNAAAAEHVVSRLPPLESGQQRVLILGLLKDKAVDAVIQVFADSSEFDRVVSVGLRGPRGQSGQQLADRCRQWVTKTPIESFATLQNAITALEGELNAGDQVLVFGSFLLVADALTHDKFN